MCLSLEAANILASKSIEKISSFTLLDSLLPFSSSPNMYDLKTKRPHGAAVGPKVLMLKHLFSPWALVRESDDVFVSKDVET